MDWAGLEARTVEAPILPELHGGDTDVSNFDAEFTDRSSVQGDLVTRSHILHLTFKLWNCTRWTLRGSINFSSRYTDAFAGFTFTNTSFGD